MMSCGLRTSEKLGIEWDYLRPLTGKRLPTLEIRQQLVIDPVTKKISENPDTKAKAGRRIIPSDKKMIQVLNN